MDERTRLGLGVLGAALFLGVLGDGLLRATPWGINLLVWVAALAGAAVAVAWRGRLRVAGEGRWLVPVALVFAAGLAWRDSPTVVLLNLLAILVAVSLAALWGRRGRLRLAGVSEYVLGGIYAGTLSYAGPVPVAAREIRWQQVARGRWRSPALAATRGVFFAAPLLLIFGALFVAADAVFEELVVDVFGFDVAEVFGHLSLMLVFAWITAGLLWVALLAHTRENLALRRPDALSLGIVELGTVLGLLDLLFFAFVAVQVRYFFGGAERVVTTAGLSYAEYARRGFFELVTVTALALPILLLTHWLLRAEGRGGRRVFRVLAGTLIALLFVVMASALQRMYPLYSGVRADRAAPLRHHLHGLARRRAGLVPADRTAGAARPLRVRRPPLRLAAVLLINAMNPDALIARVNLQRLEEGKRFDAYYLTTLSADAAPVPLRRAPGVIRETHRSRGRPDGGGGDSGSLPQRRAGRLAHLEPEPVTSRIPGRTYTSSWRDRGRGPSPEVNSR